MLRLPAVVAALVLAVAGVACGEEEADTRPPDVAQPATPADADLTLNEIETVLQREGVEVQRTTLGTGTQEVVDVPVVQKARYEIGGGAEFDVYVLPTVEATVPARRSLDRSETVEEDATILPIRNVVVVLPGVDRPESGVPAVRRILTRLREPGP